MRLKGTISSHAPQASIWVTVCPELAQREAGREELLEAAQRGLRELQAADGPKVHVLALRLHQVG